METKQTNKQLAVAILALLAMNILAIIKVKFTVQFLYVFNLLFRELSILTGRWGVCLWKDQEVQIGGTKNLSQFFFVPLAIPS